MEEKIASIPYYAHEGEMARAERTNLRLWILVILLILALIGTNAAWIYHESQYKTEELSFEVQQDTDGGGDNTFTGNTIRMIGGNDYGEADDPDNGATESEDR